MDPETPDDILAGLERSFETAGEEQVMLNLTIVAKRLGHYREELLRHGIGEGDVSKIVQAYHQVLVGLNVTLLSF